MSQALPRRRLLSGGAALAATAVLTAPSLAEAATKAPAGADPSTSVVVRWNAKLKKWDARPPKAEFGVVFLSTNDANAVAPEDKHLQPGDVWRRHPDAEEL